MDELSAFVDELSVDELSVDELSVDELSVDELSGYRHEWHERSRELIPYMMTKDQINKLICIDLSFITSINFNSLSLFLSN